MDTIYLLGTTTLSAINGSHSASAAITAAITAAFISGLAVLGSALISTQGLVKNSSLQAEINRESTLLAERRLAYAKTLGLIRIFQPFPRDPRKMEAGTAFAYDRPAMEALMAKYEQECQLWKKHAHETSAVIDMSVLLAGNSILREKIVKAGNSTMEDTWVEEYGMNKRDALHDLEKTMREEIGIPLEDNETKDVGDNGVKGIEAGGTKND